MPQLHNTMKNISKILKKLSLFNQPTWPELDAVPECLLQLH